MEMDLSVRAMILKAVAKRPKNAHQNILSEKPWQRGLHVCVRRRKVYTVLLGGVCDAAPAGEAGRGPSGCSRPPVSIPVCQSSVAGIKNNMMQAK